MPAGFKHYTQTDADKKQWPGPIPDIAVNYVQVTEEI